MIDITKTEFKKEARKGLYYFGSIITSNMNACGLLACNASGLFANIDQHIGTRKLLNDNNRNLKFETETNEYSYLDIAGKNCTVSTVTLKTRKFFIIIDSVNDQAILVVYAK